MTKKTKKIIFWTATICGVAAAVYSVYVTPKKVETPEPEKKEDDIPEIKTVEEDPAKVEEIYPHVITAEQWKAKEPEYKKVVLWWDEEEAQFYTIYGVPFEDQDVHLGWPNVIEFIEYTTAPSWMYIRNDADQTDYELCKLLAETKTEAKENPDEEPSAEPAEDGE